MQHGTFTSKADGRNDNTCNPWGLERRWRPVNHGRPRAKASPPDALDEPNHTISRPLCAVPPCANHTRPACGVMRAFCARTKGMPKA